MLAIAQLELNYLTNSSLTGWDLLLKVNSGDFLWLWSDAIASKIQACGKFDALKFMS
ncbi:hypothetical protein HCG51_11935 [Tolypothrix sp. PCC 7910]|uniref:hypothetical protein n=1 Tax=Tolypothrix sp. PCC 7910 TaxID=2099387 RepID=UPI0014277996|nr:hypothetical protein [Tolypothrix sp. PCC 7910]QIR37347.1 hypothetical protein HCG51_11935 [Tolypothrix sp. PCC 7910]